MPAALRQLASVERLRLGEFPTPLEPLAIDEIVPAFAGRAWVKREDLASPDYGGNKLRKLEFLLARALSKDARTVVTMGGVGSNHCLATAYWAPDAGLDVDIVLSPHEPTESSRRTLRALCALGPHLTLAPSEMALPGVVAARAALLAAAGRRPYVITPGGSTVRGTLGWVEGGIELAAQMQHDPPDEVWCAYSSGGTAAGLSVGLQLAGLRTQVVGVAVYPPPLTSESVVRALAGLTHKWLERRARTEAEQGRYDASLLCVRDAWVGPGYGSPSEAGIAAEAAAGTLGLELEPVYTAKAFAAFLDGARDVRDERKVVFVLTYDGRLSQRLSDGVPDVLIPPKLRPFA